MYEVKLPQWGMNMTDGDIVKWLKKEGEFVQKGEPIAEVETAKTTSDLEAPVSGVLSEIWVREGGTALVQEVVALIEES